MMQGQDTPKHQLSTSVELVADFFKKKIGMTYKDILEATGILTMSIFYIQRNNLKRKKKIVHDGSFTTEQMQNHMHTATSLKCRFDINPFAPIVMHTCQQELHSFPSWHTGVPEHFLLHPPPPSCYTFVPVSRNILKTITYKFIIYKFWHKMYVHRIWDTSRLGLRTQNDRNMTYIHMGFDYINISRKECFRMACILMTF